SLCRLLSDFDIGRAQKNVVGDQELTRPHDACTRGGMKAGVAVVGPAGRIRADFVANSFELSAADVLQTLPLRGRSRGLVEVNRNFVALPNLLSNVARHSHAIFDSNAFDGDEGDDVGSAQPRVRTLVMIQIDQLSGLAYSSNGSFLDRLSLADESDHAAIVVGVHFAVEKVHAIQFHGLNDGINFGFVPALGKIRNTLHQSL